MKFYTFLLSIFFIKCDTNDENEYLRAIKFILSSIQGKLENFNSISFENHYQIIEFFNAKVISPPTSIIKFSNNDKKFNVSNVIFTIVVDLQISIKSYNLTKILYPNSLYEFKYDNLEFKFVQDKNKIELIKDNKNSSLINTSLNTDYGVLRYFKDFTENKTINKTLIEIFDNILTQKIINSQENFNLLISNALYILALSYKKENAINIKYNDSIIINHYIVNNVYFDKKETEINESIIVFTEITFDFEIEIYLINNNIKKTINVIIKSYNEGDKNIYFSKNQFHFSNLLKFESKKYKEDFFQKIIEYYSKQLNSIIKQYKL